MGPSIFLSYSNQTLNEPAIELGTQKDAYLTTFFTIFLLGGHVGIPLALITMVITKTITQRHPTMINLLLTFSVYATSNLIVFYGGQSGKYMPDFGFCLAQASMIYASTVMAASSTLALSLQLWISLGTVDRPKLTTGKTMTNIQLLGMPWLSFICFTLICTVYGIKNPSSVTKRWVFYCTISSDGIIYTVCTFTLSFLALTLVLQGFVLRRVFQTTHKSRGFRALYNLVIRVTLFSAYIVIAFIAGIVLVLKPTAKGAYIFTSTLPLAAFLVFGTQKENMVFWFRIKNESKKDIHLQAIAFKQGIKAPSLSDTSFESRSDKPLPHITEYASPDQEHSENQA